jgi:hypothetical protein
VGPASPAARPGRSGKMSDLYFDRTISAAFFFRKRSRLFYSCKP